LSQPGTGGMQRGLAFPSLFTKLIPGDRAALREAGDSRDSQGG